jgi:hypothetical protein
MASLTISQLTKTFGTESSMSSSPTTTTNNDDTPKSTINSLEGLLQHEQKNLTDNIYNQQEEARQVDRNPSGED